MLIVNDFPQIAIIIMVIDEQWTIGHPAVVAACNFAREDQACRSCADFTVLSSLLRGWSFRRPADARAAPNRRRPERQGPRGALSAMT
jgi:hypothetical protein